MVFPILMEISIDIYTRAINFTMYRQPSAYNIPPDYQAYHLPYHEV